MKILTTWVKPPTTIKGRDPLGVRMPCEITYNALVPGITNVTDRARYYSFYPWLIWAFGQRHQSFTHDKFIELLRRADCLFTLIGIAHKESNIEDRGHTTGLIGSQKLPKVLREMEPGETLRLSTFTQLEDSAQRYFKNSLGGLGQYYLGPLRELGILDGDSKTGLKYTSQRGRPVAEAFDQGVPRNEFLKAIEKDKVSLTTLENLAAFCPCHLSANPAEQQVLLDLFFNRLGTFHEEQSQPRNATLGLMLDLVARTESMKEPDAPALTEPDLFRACVYAGALPNNSAWSVPASLLPAQQGWRIYQRNELLSIAIQGIFWAALTELGEPGELIENRAAFRQQVIAAFADAALWRKGSESFTAAVERIRNSLPDLMNWRDEEHELQLGWELLREARTSDSHESRVKVVQLAFSILLALTARDDNGQAPGNDLLDPEYMAGYPINLPRFHEYAQGDWQDMKLRELLGWLVTEWGLDVHLRVALRKLRSEGLDTFRIRPVDGGLQIMGSDLPEYTNPRLRQVCQILFDLGAMETLLDDGRAALTPLGHSLLEECRG